MSYTKTEWKAGDTVTSAKLNKIENQLEATSAKLNKIENQLEALGSGSDILTKAIAQQGIGWYDVDVEPFLAETTFTKDLFFEMESLWGYFSDIPISHFTVGKTYRVAINGTEEEVLCESDDVIMYSPPGDDPDWMMIYNNETGNYGVAVNSLREIAIAKGGSTWTAAQRQLFISERTIDKDDFIENSYGEWVYSGEGVPEEGVGSETDFGKTYIVTINGTEHYLLGNVEVAEGNPIIVASTEGELYISLPEAPTQDVTIKIEAVTTPLEDFTVKVDVVEKTYHKIDPAFIEE